MMPYSISGVYTLIRGVLHDVLQIILFSGIDWVTCILYCIVITHSCHLSSNLMSVKILKVDSSKCMIIRKYNISFISVSSYHIRVCRNWESEKFILIIFLIVGMLQILKWNIEEGCNLHLNDCHPNIFVLKWSSSLENRRFSKNFLNKIKMCFREMKKRNLCFTY